MENIWENEVPANIYKVTVIYRLSALFIERKKKKNFLLCTAFLSSENNKTLVC